MDETAGLITQLSAVLGPVGAVCAVGLMASGSLNLYLLKRLFTIQDKQMESAVADARQNADLLNGFNNMSKSFDNLASNIAALLRVRG